jgi:adenylate cyclase
VLGFDVVFAERDESTVFKQLQDLAQAPANRELAPVLSRLRPLLDRDRVLAEGLRNRAVILGYYFNQGPEKTATSGVLPRPLFPAGSFKDRHVGLLAASGYGGNLKELQDSAAAGGYFDNPTTSVDGVFRRVPMLQRYQGAVYESLSLAVAREYLGVPVRVIFAEGLGVGEDYNGLEWIGLGRRRIPVDGDVAALVPYRGPQGSFPYVSATDVLNGSIADASLFKDAIVLVGTTAPGLLDLRSTPVQKLYPGVEIHANLITGILDGRFKHRPAYVVGAELVILVLVALLLSLVLPLLGPLRASLLTAAVLVAVVAINFSIWHYADLVLPLASPLLLILVLFLFNMSYGYFFESRTRRQLGNLFGQYVPPELVEEMSRDPKRYSLQGERREMTVLFSDVRGFTTLSEGLAPEELSDLMNVFLTAMTRVIHHHRGTIDKYMGDAIMAFWGAPLHDPEHARHALEAALEMESELEAVRAAFRERGWPEIAIGIGLNTGVMSVGNMGSEFRMAYTVLGDAVNLGSRLEGLTKEYGVTTIVSETTRDAVPGFLFRELDRVRVKGKERPVAIFEPVGPDGGVEKTLRDELELFRSGLKEYRTQQWNQAESHFLDLKREHPGRRLYQFFTHTTK